MNTKRRGGRVVEGAPLLKAGISLINNVTKLLTPSRYIKDTPDDGSPKKGSLIDSSWHKVSQVEDIYQTMIDVIDVRMSDIKSDWDRDELQETRGVMVMILEGYRAQRVSKIVPFQK